MTRCRTTVALLLVGLLAGCAVAPPAPAPAPTPELPAQWQGATPPVRASGAASDWWQRFDDPLLPALVDEALAHNLDLQAAASALARARAWRDLAAAGAGLQIGGSASAGRNHSGGRSANSLRAGVDASWEADLFGANAAATASAQADADAAAAALRATRLAVAAETALAYLQWQGARAQQAAAAASLASQRQTLELVQLRQRSGLASGLEAEQALAAVEQARARVGALQHTQAQAEHALSVLVGRAPAALADRLATAPRQLASAPPLPAWPQPAALLQRRWDLQAAERRIASQLATLQQRQAERRPRVALSGNLALQAATWSALGGPGAVLAGLAVAVDWPIADGGAGAARVAAQQAALDDARTAWQAAVLAALRDVEDGLSALASAQSRVDALQGAARAADEALRLARMGYEAGLSDILTLLDSERSALTAADALVSARADLASAHVRLYKALGGGWTSDATPSTATPSPRP